MRGPAVPSEAQGEAWLAEFADGWTASATWAPAVRRRWRCSPVSAPDRAMDACWNGPSGSRPPRW